MVLMAHLLPDLPRELVKSFGLSSRQFTHVGLWGAIPFFGFLATAITTQDSFGKCVWFAAAFGPLLVAYWLRPEQHATESLYKLLPTLVNLMEIPTGENMRVTFWVPEQDGFLKQVTNYWPHNEKPSVKRMKNTTGLVGRVARNGMAEIYMVEAGTGSVGYQKDLVYFFGYSEDAAKRVNQMQRSFLSIPIIRDNEKVGIFYCDSSSEGLFRAPRYDENWLTRATEIASLVEPLF